jgi:hypothetical protein
MLAQFGPVGLAMEAIGAVLKPLQPLLDALLVPFTIMGEILASLIVPVLRRALPAAEDAGDRGELHRRGDREGGRRDRHRHRLAGARHRAPGEQAARLARAIRW